MVFVPEARLHRRGMLHHQGAAPALTCFPGDLELASHFPESPGPVWQSPAPQTPEGASTPGPYSIWPQGLRLLRPQERHERLCCRVQAHLMSATGLLSCFTTRFCMSGHTPSPNGLTFGQYITSCTHICMHFPRDLAQGPQCRHQAVWTTSSPCQYEGQQLSSPFWMHPSSSSFFSAILLL